MPSKNTLRKKQLQKKAKSHKKKEYSRAISYVNIQNEGPIVTWGAGNNHTIFISYDGNLFPFFSNNKRTSFSNILYLPKIILVSCGAGFSMCVDEKGTLWSIGSNTRGQLGIGHCNKKPTKVLRKVANIPFVQSISCGESHVLIITQDSNLWTLGRNDYRQLFLDNTQDQWSPKQTPFYDVTMVSAGAVHSFFQNAQQEIYGCGYNSNGELAQGHFNEVVEPCIIPNSSWFAKLCTGHHHSLFLDKKGNVFSVGHNQYGSLGLNNNTHIHTPQQIQNIPLIRTIGCVGFSSYLIDIKNDVWAFGENAKGQLGVGDTNDRNTPVKIDSLNNIVQISHGSCGEHFLAKDSNGTIFATGRNIYQEYNLFDSKKNNEIISIPTEINSTNFNVWRYLKESDKGKWKQMCTEETMNWQEEDVQKLSKLQSKIELVKSNLLSKNNAKFKQEFPQNSFESWKEVQSFLSEKLQQVDAKVNGDLVVRGEIKENINTLELELTTIESQIKQLQQKKKDIEQNLLPTAKKREITFEENFQIITNNQKILNIMNNEVSFFCNNETEMKNDIEKLFNDKKFEKFDNQDISKLLWSMDLTKYQDVFELNKIDGEFVAVMTDEINMWKQIGLKKRDCLFVSFQFKMMKCPGFKKTFSPDYEDDCFVCSHNTPEKTIHLLQEYDIPIDAEFIFKNNYTASTLTFPRSLVLDEIDYLSDKGRQITIGLAGWTKAHKNHLKNLRK